MNDNSLGVSVFMSQLGDQDFFIVGAFLVLCLIIGLYKTTQIKTLKDFALGFQTISTTTLVCIIFASSIGAGSTIGITGKIYEFGAIIVIKQLLVPLYWFITAKIIGSNIARFKGCITLGEIAHNLYGKFGRWIIALASILHSFGAIAAQALALGGVFYYFFGLDPSDGIFIGYGIITIYSALGGIRAVVHTEIFKFIIFFFIIPIAYITVFADTGGIKSIISLMPENYLKIKLSEENISLLAGFAIYSLLPGVDPALIQRCLIASEPKKLERALKMIAFISLPFSGALCLIAYKMRAVYPDIDPNNALLQFIALLPDGLKGIMVCGIMAAIMSLAEAKLNATSVILVHDILAVIRPKVSDMHQVIALRLTTVILAVFSLGMIHFSSDILELIWMVANFWEPIVAIPIIAGFLGFKTNARSFLTSSVIAIMFTIIAGFITKEFAITSWCFGILGSAIGLFGMHYYQVATGGIKGSPPLMDALHNALINLNQMRVKYTGNLLQFLKLSVRLITENPGNHKLEIAKFCIYTFSYYFLYSLDITNTPDHKMFSYLISIGYTLCLALLFREYAISKRVLEKYLHYYWYFLLTFCLPFISSYMLFVGYHDPFWIISGILSAFSLFLFLDARRFFLLYSMGVLGAIVLFKFTGHTFGSAEEITAVSYIAYIYLAFIFASLVFFRNKELEHEEKIATMEFFGGAMAHEVRTPLASLKMCTNTIRSIAEDSTIKSGNNAGTIKINPKDAVVFLKMVGFLEEASMSGIKTVDSLLRSLRNDTEVEDIAIYSIKEIIEEALDTYKTSYPERDNLEINIKDNFQVKCSKNQLMLVLVNLLNNAYKYAGRGARIELWTEHHKLHFKDYGKGISEENLPKIFDKFYTQSQGGGTGIGLAFCKDAMHKMNGSIECHSILGGFTEFILYFPRLSVKNLM